MLLLHLFRKQWTKPRRTTVDPFGASALVEEHLHQTGVDLLHPSGQPFAMPFGDHALSGLHLDHRSLRPVLTQIVLDEQTGRWMDVLPDVLRCFADQTNVVGSHVLGVTIVEEDEIAPLVVQLERFGNDAGIVVGALIGLLLVEQSDYTSS